MRILGDYILDHSDGNELFEEQEVVLPIESVRLTGTYLDGGFYVIRREGVVVAAIANGMLHESLILFAPDLEELLAFDGVVVDNYEMDPVSEPYEEFITMPSQAAVWLKRMPGMFMTSSPLILVPEQVHPRKDQNDFSVAAIQGDDFNHIMYLFERALENEHNRASWGGKPRFSMVSGNTEES